MFWITRSISILSGGVYYLDFAVLIDAKSIEINVIHAGFNFSN
jgi:hypothetical protein